MGIYDRDYYQDDNAPRGYYFGGKRLMMVTNLVLVTAAVFIVNIFAKNWLNDHLALQNDVYRRPWEAYQLLTYGFLHAPGIWHIGLNMFMLWMFGRGIEERLGRREFLLFYLSAIVFAGLTWVLGCWLEHKAAAVVGASGGVVAVFIMFVFYYPKQTVYVWGLLAVPAWLIGALVIGSDLLRAVTGHTDVAWEAHLGGAAFAFLYLKLGLNFSRLLPSGGSRGWSWRLPRRKPKLRVHDPAADDDLAAEADRILAKVHREGEESLTGRERRTLEKYSRSVRDRRS